MKITPAFFRSDQIRRLLDRAAAVSALPMSLHYLTHDGNELYVMGWGGCEICGHMKNSHAGVQACRNGRARAAALALQQRVPVTFVCPLGFTCVSVAALAEGDYVLTFGPYIPAEAHQEIAYDVARGLREIDADIQPDGELPFVLDDVRIVPAGAVSATAEWLVEALCAAADRYSAPEDAPPGDDEIEASLKEGDSKVKATPSGVNAGEWISWAALALVCGSSSIVHKALADKLEEQGSSKRTPADALQAFLVQSVSQLLEAARRMGGDTENALTGYSRLTVEVRELNEPATMLKAAMRVLRRVRANTRKPMPAYLPKLVAIVDKRYRDDLRLTALAEEFGVAPSSVTRALECRLNASFTEYLGRVRIAYAQRLLRNTQLTSTQIAPRVGIPDQSNFGKLFRQYAGMTPGQYRARFQPRRKVEK